MLGVETRENGLMDACMAVFNTDDVRYSDRRHFFFITRPLLLNTRLLLTSVYEKGKFVAHLQIPVFLLNQNHKNHIKPQKPI